ncbi:MAG: phosphodiester glycosidase family protein [Oscillospiraceae bacterium]|nr:phosphodiester glycosidase family protein [Oscillospiraceae bacterium]
MMKKFLACLLTLAVLLSLVPTVWAAPGGEREEGAEAYSGTLDNSTDLLFEFDNRAEDQQRYKGAAYGGLNYDQETNGYWATAYNGSYTAYNLVNSGGSLRVHVTSDTDGGGTYGPWVKITNTYGKMPSYNTNSYDLYPLNFDPSAVKTVTIRFKLVNCSVPTGKVPEIVFEYYFTKNGSYSYANDMKAIYTYRDGEYMTVSIPASSKLTGADVLKGFGFRFRHIKGGNNARIYIDYMYIGAKSSFVMQDHVDKTFLSQNTIPIVSGVKRNQIALKNGGDNTPINAYLTTVSPSAKVTFKASYASYYTKGSTVESRKTACLSMPFSRMVATDHAAAYEAATGDTVLMVTNGNFFDGDTNHPRGYLVLEENIVQTYDSFPAPYFAVLKDGSFAIRPYGYPLGDVKEAVSGYQWLVRDGVLVTTNDDVTAAPRTAIGLKADGTVVWLALDGRQEGYSMGVTIHELAELMYAAGCVNAINMDGGGSTTMAGRYNGTGDLVLQNSPSDEGGARLLPTCLLMVAEPCNHKLSGQAYTVYADGTHSRICSSCGEVIRVVHTYNNGTCVCGDKRHLGDGLFFDYSNTDEDKYRYTDPVYQYRNFDLTSNGTWGRGYWSTAYTANDSTADFSINNKNGTLVLNVGQGHSGSAENNNVTYGPWLKLTSAYGKSPTKTDGRFGALSYDPKDIDYVEIRFKMDKCLVDSGKSPDVVFEYYYTKDGVYQGSTDMIQKYTFVSGEYITVRIPATENLKQAQELQAFGFRFRHIKGNTSGKLTVDYIYVGSDGIKEPMVDESLQLSHSLNLASDISVNFVVPKIMLEGYDMSTVYVESQMDLYDGDRVSGTKTIRMEPVDKGNSYYFTLDGLTAVQMNDRIRSVIYGTKEGQPYYSPMEDYSISDYAYSQLNKTNTTDALRTLCADLLRYGAKAQIYKNYRTDALADQLMTEAHRSYLSDAEAVTFGNVNVTGSELSKPAVSWVGKSLDLNSKVTVLYVINTASYTGKVEDLTLKVSYLNCSGEAVTVTQEAPKAYGNTGVTYAFYLDELLAAELRTVLTAQVYEGNTPVSNTLTYTADTYGNNKTGALGELCRALFAYSDSAKAYFAN